MKIGNGFIVAIIFLFSFNSCGLHSEKNECAQVACSKVFTILNVELNNPDGTAFIADSTQTFFDNQLIHTSYGEFFPGGGSFYTIADDGYTNKYYKAIGNNTLLKVYKNGNLVAQSTFSITADCCHISKLSGPAVLVVP